MFFINKKLTTIFLGDSRVYRKNNRSRRGSTGTKSLDVFWDGIERITEIILEVRSDNDDIKAKIIKGGIGKDQVRIEVTGRDTSFIEYDVEIFGRP